MTEAVGISLRIELLASGNDTIGTGKQHTCKKAFLLIGEYRDDGKFYFIKRLTARLNQFNRPEILSQIKDLKTNTVPFRSLRVACEDVVVGFDEHRLKAMIKTAC